MQASGSGSQQRPIPRRAHKKSKTGCRTCKVRKVKCDERRPLCANCERHFTNLVACDFEDQQQRYQPASAPSPIPQVGEPSTQARLRSVQPTQLPILPASPVGRAAEPLKLPLPSTISAGRIDPFEARPASLAPASSVDGLIGHYLSDFAFRSFPFYASRPLIELWWPFIRSDDLLFHVVLLLSGLDRAHLQSQFDTIQTRQMLDQCLTLLNARLQDSVASTSDQTLVAVASLAAMEHERGNMRALDMHLKGLKNIVELRGGLDAVRVTNAMAANVVFYCALVSINEPSLLPISFGDQQRSLDWLENPATATLATHDGSNADLKDFGVDVVTANVLHETQRLWRLYLATVDYGSPVEALTVLTHLCAIIERLLQLSKSPAEDSPVRGLSRSCRLAGCLHVLTPLSGYFPNPTLMLHTLVRDLKASLTYMIAEVGTESHLLLWLLAVGGITAHSMPERAWFVGHLVVVITDLGIQSWDTMRQYLVRLAFHDNFCDISFAALWEEVRQKQQVLNLAPVESVP